MMKGGFNLVHCAIDMIEPHVTWDCDNIGEAAPMSHDHDSFHVVVDSNSERNELSEWVERVTKQLIDDSETGSESEAPMVPEECLPRNSARRSYFHGVNSGELEGNSNNSVEQNSGNKNLSRVDEHGLGLLTLLLECAVAISVDNLGEAHRILLELTQMASPYCLSCAERIVAYFSEAMFSRVINSWLGICTPLVDHKSIHAAFQVLNNVTPFVKFAHFTSNQAILEAVHRRDWVHIIDLDIMQGLQWPALFHILANRMEGPPQVRLTGFGTSLELLTDTGRQLSNFARRLGMSFEFHPVAKKFGEIDASMLQLRRGEALAVHWSQHSLYDTVGPNWKAIRLIEQLSPRVITLVEQDITHGGSFLDRFVGSLHYYSTLFDSLGAYLPCDDPNRHRVEQGLMHREINNILAVGGPMRSGDEKFRNWRAELGARSSCFGQIPMSANSMAQAQLILNMFPPAHGYRLVNGEGALKLGWKETSLYTASAWTSHVQVR